MARIWIQPKVILTLNKMPQPSIKSMRLNLRNLASLWIMMKFILLLRGKANTDLIRYSLPSVCNLVRLISLSAWIFLNGHFHQKKVRDAFSSKKKSSRILEYEQLAMWHGGDAEPSKDCRRRSRRTLNLEEEEKTQAHDYSEPEWELL